MLKKRWNKKAFGQIDWPISLGFFLVYLIWFFVIISPLAKTPQEAPAPVMDILEEKFNENSQWELVSAPVIATGNLRGDSEPLIASIPSNYLQDNVYMYGKYFLIDEGKVILLEDTTQKRFFWLLKTDKEYTLPSFTADLTGDETYSSVSSKNFRADFSSGLLTNVEYDSRDRITDLDIFVGGSAISTASNNFTDNPMVHKYKIDSTADNIHYVFGDNSRIYSFIQTSSSTNIELNFSLDNYTDYYVSSGDSGTINYGGSSCSSRTGDFVNFYDSNDALTFTTGEDVTIRICNTPTTLTLSLSENINGELSYHAIFHEGDKDEGLNFSGADTKAGVFEVIKGLSKEKLDELGLESYLNLKNEWAFPGESDFKIIVYNSTSVLDNSTKIFEVGDESFELAEVHAKTIKTDLIDQYNNRIRSTVNLRVWK